MTPQRIFGTDGIRGRAGEGWLSAAGAAAVGRAVGSVLARNGEVGHGSSTRALLGHDGRRSGPDLEAAVARGLADAGLASTSAGLITTPGLALLARLRGAPLAVMISASHNPAEDNGIKVFSGAGEKLSDEVELAIEAQLARAVLDPSDTAGAQPELDPSLELDYLAYLVERAAAVLRLDGLALVVDCANGGASRVAPRVFGRLGAQVHAFAAEPDGDNINRGSGATHPAALQAEVRRTGAKLGIALDGDGDRCILADERGTVVNGDGILTVLARRARELGQLADPRIVATVMSNHGLHRALRDVGVTVVTVDVGDRNVVERLRRERLTLGGEQSGHIVFGPDHFFIGDGIYTALRVLRTMRETQKSLAELAAPYRPFPQVLVNVPVVRKPALDQVPRVREAVARLEEELHGDGRVLLRYSGTEPLARLMIEGPDAEMIHERAQILAQLIGVELGS